MGILYKRQFKKLREEYADLGNVKLDLIEEMARSSNYGTYNNDIQTYRLNVKLDHLDEYEIPRGMEYYLKYRALLKKCDNAVLGISLGAVGGFTTLLIILGIKSGEKQRTLDEEYSRGRNDVYKDIEKYCMDRNGEDSYIGDASNGQHMILRISDEETEDYKELQNDLKELDEYDADLI